MPFVTEQDRMPWISGSGYARFPEQLPLEQRFSECVDQLLAHFAAKNPTGHVSSRDQAIIEDVCRESLGIPWYKWTAYEPWVEGLKVVEHVAAKPWEWILGPTADKFGESAATGLLALIWGIAICGVVLLVRRRALAVRFLSRALFALTGYDSRTMRERWRRY